MTLLVSFFPLWCVASQSKKSEEAVEAVNGGKEKKRKKEKKGEKEKEIQKKRGKEKIKPRHSFCRDLISSGVMLRGTFRVDSLFENEIQPRET